MPALTPANRSVVAWTCLWHALVALLLAVGGWCGDACAAARDDAHAAWCAAADELGTPSRATLAAAADDHEECALVEGVPESSEDDPALAWPWPASDFGWQARARSQATAGTWRRAPARRKCARGPPAAAN